MNDHTAFFEYLRLQCERELIPPDALDYEQQDDALTDVMDIYYEQLTEEEYQASGEVIKVLNHWINKWLHQATDP